MVKKILVLFVSLFLSIFVFVVKANAIENYVDEDGNVLYGWHMETNETDAETWEFDANGNPTASYSAEGDTGNQFTNNYAIRNLKIDANASYTLQTTYTPDPDSDLSVERAYGLLVWYQDPENFLIYWLMQKPNEWSGQFYGRVNNVYRSFYMTQETAGLGNIGYSDSWRRSEFNDMWWDSLHAHPTLRNVRAAIINNSVTLKVTSAVETVTVAGVAEESRYFEVNQIVNGSEHLTSKMYIKDITSNSGGFYTGLYTERFNVNISDYSLVSSTDFAAPVNAEIAELPTTISSDAEMQKVIDAAGNYKALLSYKSGVTAENASKIEALDASVASYVDSRILGLDVNQTTFVDDAFAVLDLYENLPVEYQDEVTQVEALAEALEKAESWEDPTIVKPVVEILTPSTANTGDVVEVKYTATDNITSSENLEITVTVKKGVTTNVSLTDNKFTAQEGTYTIKVTAKDEHGNIGTANLTLTVTTLDTEKPAITITTPTSAKVGDEVEVKYNVTDNASSASDLEVIVSVVKNGSVVNLTNNKFVAEAGTYSITVSAKDAAGNVNSASIDVVVNPDDTTKPTVTITTPTTAEVGEEVFVTYTASDDKSAANKMTYVVKVEKDGAEVAVTNNKFVAEAGTYTITLTVTDEAGNSTVATSTLTVAAGSSDAPAPSSNGCGGSIATSLFGLLSLAAMVLAVAKKRKQN